MLQDNGDFDAKATGVYIAFTPAMLSACLCSALYLAELAWSTIGKVLIVRDYQLMCHAPIALDATAAAFVPAWHWRGEG